MRVLISEQERTEAARAESLLAEKLARIDEELTLYHPSGAYSFLKERLESLRKEQLSALEFGPEEGVNAARAKLSIIRHLLSLPEELQQERARVQEQLNESV